MVNRWQYRILTIAGVLAIVLAIVNATLFIENRGMQITVNTRQQYIQQSIQLQGLYIEIVKSLADLSANKNDEQLRDLLKTHGFTITVNPVASSSPPAKTTGR